MEDPIQNSQEESQEEAASGHGQIGGGVAIVGSF